MLVLGIETSCDETAAAVVATTGDAAKPWVVRSNVIASQVEIHREWGGVVPEIASRQHVRDICGVVERALADAGTPWAAIDAIAVTQGPGLVGSLLVGVSFAKAAAAALGKPIVAVHHLAGHIESIFLDHGAIPLPAAVLVVSGGHTSVYLGAGRQARINSSAVRATTRRARPMTRWRGCSVWGIQAVRPSIGSRGRATTGPFDFPRPRFTHPDRHGRPSELAPDLPAGVAQIADFSFSGLKTAVVRLLQERGVPAVAGPGSADRRRNALPAGRGRYLRLVSARRRRDTR